MSGKQLLSEIAACVGIFIFLFVLLVGGSAAIPYQPPAHSEATFTEGDQ